MITTDTEAWQKYPFHRKWFNKLWVSELFGYVCGPNAVPVPKNDTYIIRPIYNLHGMGAGARFIKITTQNINAVPPGYFWCEKFTGRHFTVELVWNTGRWNIVSVFEGMHHSDTELYRFTKWKRVEVDIIIPEQLNELWDCGYINVEFIDKKVIEVHLRGTPDPIKYDEFIPIWNDTPRSVSDELDRTHTYIPSYDFVYGTNISRIGFYCK